MPIPDGSMPFNIITLVSSVLAFLVGSLINALVRQKNSTTSKVAASVPATTVTAPVVEVESTENTIIDDNDDDDDDIVDRTSLG